MVAQRSLFGALAVGFLALGCAEDDRLLEQATPEDPTAETSDSPVAPGAACADGPRELARIGLYTHDLAVDQGYLYAAHRQGVTRVRADYPVPVLIAQGDTRRLVVRDEHIYYQQENLFRAAKTGAGHPVRVVNTDAKGWVLGDTHLVYRRWSGELERAPREGGPAEVIGLAHGEPVAIDERAVFLIPTGGEDLVVAQDLTTGDVTPILTRTAQVGDRIDLIADDEWALFLITSSPHEAFCRLIRVPKDGRVPQILAKIDWVTQAMNVDDEHVYWIERKVCDECTPRARLRKISKRGGLAAHLYNVDVNLGSLVTDDSCVYAVTLGTGTIWAFPKIGGARSGDEY